MQIWQFLIPWSLPISWTRRVVSWKQLSIFDKLFSILSRIARNYLGLQQQMIWTILHCFHQSSQVFWNMWCQILALLTSPDLWSTLSCQFGKISACWVSNGKWKLHKYILLASTIRHLYRGKKLVIIINRLGHWESYNYISELDNVMVMALEDVSSLEISQFGVNNKVFHLEWDNLNKFTTNIHGNNAVNHTGGIMIQEVKSDIEYYSSGANIAFVQ